MSHVPERFSVWSQTRIRQRLPPPLLLSSSSSSAPPAHSSTILSLFLARCLPLSVCVFWIPVLERTSPPGPARVSIFSAVPADAALALVIPTEARSSSPLSASWSQTQRHHRPMTRTTPALPPLLPPLPVRGSAWWIYRRWSKSGILWGCLPGDGQSGGTFLVWIRITPWAEMHKGELDPSCVRAARNPGFESPSRDYAWIKTWIKTFQYLLWCFVFFNLSSCYICVL